MTMATLTDLYINDHCANLGITRDKLTAFVFPDGVTEIGEAAFGNCTSLKSITIPDGVTEIGPWAFNGCTSLQSITIPDSVTRIADISFNGCTSLESIIIPDSVTEIGESAFRKCTSLTSITLPDTVTKIRSVTFDGCTSLEYIIIPDRVTTIGEYAFRNCTSLTSITLPDTVTEIGNAAFHSTSLTSIIIPDGVTEIGEFAFGNCTALRSIIIPDGVTKIGQGAFSNCSSLTQVICNNPDLFLDDNIVNKDQIQFISATDYFNDNYQDLLIALESSELNTNSLSNKELNLLMRLDQEDYLPNWKTIATTFNERSMDQIHSILSYFNKTSCMPNTENSIFFKITGKVPVTINGLSMFLNSTDHVNLTMTAKNVVLRTKLKIQEHASAPEPKEEHRSAAYCSMQ